MKKTLSVLCLTLVSFAQIAFGDDVNSIPHLTNSASTSLRTRPMLVWTETAAPVRRLVEKGVPNFGKLNAYVWRSGQPSRAGYERLATQGLKTVINLRKESPQDKDLLPKGVQYFYIPILDNGAPTDEQAKQFLKIVSNPDNWPILVHCKGGEGRAGVMSALVRHSFDGWDHDLVMKEVDNFRVRHLGLIKIGMVGSQRDFIRRWEEANPAREYLPAATKEGKR
jgi:protein tyrosine phosphatase (PTP) superfamily phosphohydrolase (DUF442 family)